MNETELKPITVRRAGVATGLGSDVVLQAIRNGDLASTQNKLRAKVSGHWIDPKALDKFVRKMGRGHLAATEIAMAMNRNIK